MIPVIAGSLFIGGCGDCDQKDITNLKTKIEQDSIKYAIKYDNLKEKNLELSKIAKEYQFLGAVIKIGEYEEYLKKYEELPSELEETNLLYKQVYKDFSDFIKEWYKKPEGSSKIKGTFDAELKDGKFHFNDRWSGHYYFDVGMDGMQEKDSIKYRGHPKEAMEELHPEVQADVADDYARSLVRIMNWGGYKDY